MKLLLTIKLAQEQIKQLEDLGCEILFENERTSEFRGDYTGVEAILTHRGLAKLSPDLLPDLKWIQLSSIGFDQVPPAFFNYTITNLHGGYSPQIGEWLVGLVLAMEKQFFALYRQQQARIWRPLKTISSLTGKRLVFLGTGSLARESVKRLAPFGAVLIGLNRTGQPVAGFDETYSLGEAKDSLAQADYVINTLPATPETIGLIDRDFLLHLPEGANFINLSRGAVVQEQALIDCHKHLGLMALDVFQTEPLPADSPLWELPNLFISPHNSWLDQTVDQVRFELFYDNLARYLSGRELRNQVDPARGY